MLTFVGLGLYDELDISIKGLEAVRNADAVFAEFYTSVLAGTTVAKLEELYGKKVALLKREDLEQRFEGLLAVAKEKKVVLLCAGDPMTATTHAFLKNEATRQGIKTEIVHGASIYTAAPAILGLHIYKFGRSVSLPRPEEGFFPTSPYYGILKNRENGLHTLILLDIKAEQNYLMRANEGMQILLDMEARERKGLFSQNIKICVVARAGSPDGIAAWGEISKLVQMNFGKPPHVLVLPGELHFTEMESLSLIEVR
ncbi:MAG: diphthine synthase [Thermoplasmata archaeon]|nr:diphthine synthase [Thermoplasmata archaeon]